MLTISANRLERVTQDEFSEFIRNNFHLEGKPITGTNISVMQYVNGDNVVMAQAQYLKTGDFVSKVYEVRK